MAWHFVARGHDAKTAIATLDQLIARLSNSLNPDISIAVNTYLGWVEQASGMLANILESRAEADALYSERHWRIRALDSHAIRPFPLIESEVNTQKARLQAIRDELQKYSEMVAVPENGQVLVCDTNVYMHAKLFTEPPWDQIAGASFALLLVPLVVVDELDDIKDRGGADSRWARRVIREMQTLAPHSNGLGPFKVRDRVSMQFVDEPRGHRRLTRADDEIIQQAEYFSNLSGARLKVVSFDRGMHLRAQSTDLSYLELPSAYERKKGEECLPETTIPTT